MAPSAPRILVEKAIVKGVLGFFPQRTLLRRGPEERKKVALTFDDGPHPEGTPKVLEILASRQVKATFFLVGNRAEAHPNLVRRIVEEMHEIGNHTQSHKVLPEMDREEWIEEIEGGDRTLERLAGQAISLFRPPHGKLTLPILCHLAKRGKITVLWSKDPKDFAVDQEELLWEKLSEKRFRSGEIVLLHDWVPTTAAGLPRLIDSIREQGFSFTTIGAMLK